ncbi:AMP-binding protein [Actinomadura sp. HBU206391]|uniref:AMP-binding protein n=1 Tax=Actinomadura sp. HBU206391 TaxID=2731692 RepID=UPI00164F7EFC|nr:AMP-binding protein [Actinomadura sp. HBU206391]MBC6462028.1 AMP-binding protein [Actinomadura sp. HBU206391]
MAELLLPHANAAPDEPALTDEWGTTTWREFDQRVNRLIGVLRGLGLGVGDTIAIHSGNRREYFELMAAATHAGLHYAMVNWHWTAEELRYVLMDSGAVVLFSEAAFADVATAGAEGVDLKARVALGGEIPGFTAYEEFVAGGSPEEPADQTLGVTLIYTSGTTGRPKAVRRKLLAAGIPVATMKLITDVFAEILLIPAHGRTLLVGPVYHSAQWLWSYGLLVAGRSIVMRQVFDAAETLRLIDEHRITNVHLVPTQFVRLLRLDERTRAGFDGSSLAAVWHGAAPCSRQVKRQMIEWWGPVVHEYYGSTESAVNTVVTAEEWLARPGTVGRPLPMTEVHVLLADGTPAAPGERGQLWFRYTSGDDVEYHGDADKTAAMHRDDGLFTTGDIGYFDAEGYLFLADRAIDMIISAGVNIYPAEIEGVLITHPAVGDVAVFGIPDEEFGEQVKAAVQLVDGATPSDGLAEELVAHCRATLAGYKAPKSVDFVTEMPRTPTGKLYKRLLRDPYWADRERVI